MKKWLLRHTNSFIILSVLLIVQSFYIELKNPFKNPIAGDAQGYYAYLPAIFIYGDLHYEFVETVQEKYYAPSLRKSFLKKAGDSKVNKTFPGVSILYFPGFILAHATALLTGVPADGYSWIYQLGFLINFWFFVFLGIHYCQKVLTQLSFSTRTTFYSTALIFIGTNIFFYTVYDQSVTHVFTFFLVAFSSSLLLDNKYLFNAKKTYLFFGIFALLLIIRPTNILLILVYLFLIPSLDFYKSYLAKCFQFKILWKLILICSSILFIPPLLWKLQTGHWIVYSYGEEGFNFTKPEWFNFLFSYTKGWFVYTPLIFLILIIGSAIFIKNKYTSKLILLFVTLVLTIYIFSSWWCWYYGAGMSQRVMIDFYLIFAIILGYILNWIKNQKTIIRFSLQTLFVLLLILNIFQSVQIAHGILPFGSPTKEQYWDSFLSLRKRAKVYPQPHWILEKSERVSLNPKDRNFIKGNTILENDTYVFKLNLLETYSPSVSLPLINAVKGTKLIVSFEAMSSQAIESSRMIINLNDQHQEIFYFASYVQNEWEQLDFMIEFTENETLNPTLFFWNGDSNEELTIRNLSYNIYFSDTYF